MRTKCLRVCDVGQRKKQKTNETKEDKHTWGLVEYCNKLCEYVANCIRMHCLNAFRIRMIIILLATFIFWQIFRNWPGSDDYAVSCQRLDLFDVKKNEFLLFFELNRICRVQLVHQWSWWCFMRLYVRIQSISYSSNYSRRTRKHRRSSIFNWSPMEKQRYALHICFIIYTHVLFSFSFSLIYSFYFY